jgi:hypothetical protein
MIEYFDLLCNASSFIQKFKTDIVHLSFGKSEKIDEEYYFTPRYLSYWQPLQNIASVFDVLEIENLQKNKIYIIGCLSGLRNTAYKANFERCVDNLKECFGEAEYEANEKISLLEKDEYIRLNEALNCYIEECNYSTVVMSVSAVERRLYSLMVSKNPIEEAKLEKFPLGALIKEYADNKERYGSVVLSKHLPLLDYCNVYRVFSAHPKKEKITRATATAIMGMTFSFLFDREQKAKIRNE